MSLNKLKSRGLSTITSVSVAGTVLSPVCANALDAGFDEEKEVYYLVSDGKREEFKSVLSFVFAFLSKIFAFDKKVKGEKSNKDVGGIPTADNASENSVRAKGKLSPDDSADVHKSVKDIMEKLSQEYVLVSENWMPIDQDENFKSNSGSYSCYFCTKDHYKSYKLNLHASARVAKVTVDVGKLTVDYTVSGLDKVVTVNLNEKDSLQKAADLLESIRSHEQSLRGIGDLKHKGTVTYSKKDGSMKVCASDGEEWKFYTDDYKGYCIVEEMIINKHSFVTLRYKDGKEVYYNLTNVEDAKNLQNVFKHSCFVELPKGSFYKMEHSNFTI